MQVLEPKVRLGQMAALSLRARFHLESARCLCSRFLRDRRGSTAIEFVALALPFLLLVFAILESCLSFAAQQALTNATDDVARDLRTGFILADETSEADIKSRICTKLAIIIVGNCERNLTVDLRQFATFEKAAEPRVRIVDKVLSPGEIGFNPGGAGTINMLRAFYPWPVYTDLMRPMSNLKDGKTLLFATATWQNEPF